MNRQTILQPLALAAVVVVAATLGGCASEAFTGYCAMKPIAQNRSTGVTYAMVHCEAAE